VYRLYYDVTQYLLSNEEQNWNFVHIQHADSSHLDGLAQHFGIRLESHQSRFEQDALCLIEIRLRQELRGTAAFSQR
jgi:DNA polymerase III epsilon subunit-like protein